MNILNSSSTTEIGYSSLVSRLLEEKNLDIEKKGADGRTALRIAAETGPFVVLKLLLQAGANPHERLDGRTLLHRVYSPESAYELICQGVDCNIQDDDVSFLSMLKGREILLCIILEEAKHFIVYCSMEKQM